MFSVSESEIVVEIDAAAHLSPQRLLQKYGALENLKWAGSAAHLQHDFLEGYAREHGIAFVEQSPEASNVQSQSAAWTLAAKETNLARSVSALALQRFQAGKLQSPDSLSAIYVRPSDAELNERCR
jgi:hypothetical protein